MKKEKKIIIGLLIALFILSGFLLWRSWSREEVVESVVDNRAYSRLSFFAGSNYRVSLAVPEDWEGEYRVKENGNTVRFYYIGRPETPELMFELIFYEKSAWNNLTFEAKNSLKIVYNDENRVFVYSLSTDFGEKGEKNEKFEKMMGEAEKILKSLNVSRK